MFRAYPMGDCLVNSAEQQNERERDAMATVSELTDNFSELPDRLLHFLAFAALTLGS